MIARTKHELSMTSYKLNASSSSMLSISLAYREIILPIGVHSKKYTGYLMIFFNKFLCISLAASNADNHNINSEEQTDTPKI